MVRPRVWLVILPVLLATEVLQQTVCLVLPAPISLQGPNSASSVPHPSILPALAVQHALLIV